MGTVAFFPWLESAEGIDTNEFSLIQFRRGEAPGGRNTELQQILDGILEPYLAGPGRPVSTATIVVLPNREVTGNLTQEDTDELFLFSEIVAFAGLARREFFGFGLCYVNHDLFTFMIQSFKAMPGAVCVETRRRDGITSNLVTPGAYKIRRPFHIPGNVCPVGIDTALIQALLQSRDTDRWSRYHEAIFDFNRANTDSDQITEQMELILLNGAFERLFDLRGGKEYELADRVANTLCPSMRVDPNSGGRIRSEERSSLTEIWIRDFFRLRGNLAHGRSRPTYPSMWDIQEHLLLGSYAFPLIVKVVLAHDGLYELTEDDAFDIDVFELLASAHLFTKPKDGKSWPWDEIRSQARLERGFHCVASRVISDMIDKADLK